MRENVAVVALSLWGHPMSRMLVLTSACVRFLAGFCVPSHSIMIQFNGWSAMGDLVECLIEVQKHFIDLLLVVEGI